VRERLHGKVGRRHAGAAMICCTSASSAGHSASTRDQLPTMRLISSALK